MSITAYIETTLVVLEKTLLATKKFWERGKVNKPLFLSYTDLHKLHDTHKGYKVKINGIQH